LSDGEAESWLTQEADDLLAQGTVGLYEFIWGLRGASFGLSDAEAIEVAARVAERIVAAGRAAVYAVTWPDMTVEEGPLPVDTLRDPRSWVEGESGPLMALVPADSAG
jgi:hypothetical protein